MKKKKTNLSVPARELLRLVDKEEVLKEKSNRPYYMVADYLGRHVRQACLASSFHSYGGTQLYVFDGIKYSAVDWVSFSNIIYDVLMELGLPDGNLKKIGYLTRLCHQAAMEKELRPDPAVVTFDNVALDMDGGISRKFTPKWISVTKMTYDYDPDAHCERWKIFLDEVLPDKSMQKTLQEFLGCVFIDRKKAKIEKMLVLLGPGANGKSVVHDVVRALLGEDNVTAFGLGELTQGYELKKNIATINGKRLNYASEISATTFTHVNDQLKKLISGEPMSARENYGNNLTVTDIPLIMANANKLPAMKADDIKAMARRFIILPFNVEIPEHKQNPMLAREICDELPGIFNWVMEGRQRYISNGYAFSDAQSADKVAGTYRMEASTVMEFLIARGYEARRRETFEQPKWVKASDLYKEYHEWCLRQGKASDTIESQIKFGARLTSDMNFRKKSMGKGVVYGIYADEVKLQYTPDSERNLVRKDIDNKPFLDIQGRKWVKKRSGLAEALKVGISIIRECLEQGVFTGLVKQDGKAKYYDIEGCRKALSLYLREKEMSKKCEPGTGESKELWAKRGKFNKKMEKIGEPYRKYGAKMTHNDPEGLGFILVPDDWEYEKEIPVSQQSAKIKRRNYNPTEEINIENFEL